MGYNRSTSNFSCFSATSLASFNRKHGTLGEKGIVRIVRIVGVEEIKELGSGHMTGRSWYVSFCGCGLVRCFV